MSTPFVVAASVAAAAAVFLLAVRGRAIGRGTAWVLLGAAVAMASFEACVADQTCIGPLRPGQPAHAVVAFVGVGFAFALGVGHAVARWCATPFVPLGSRSRAKVATELLWFVWPFLAVGWLFVLLDGMSMVVGPGGSIGLFAGCAAMAGGFLRFGPRAFGAQACPMAASSIYCASPFLALWSLWAIGSAMPPFLVNL
jgi:hypothetical protein